MDYRVAKYVWGTAMLSLCLAAPVVFQRAHAAAAADVILRAAAGRVVGSAWTVVADSTAAGASRVANPNLGAAKRTSALAAPASYVELTFTAAANTPYRMWIRGKAQGNRYTNDSAYVQFSDSVTAGGTPTWRIGTTSATSYVLENASGAGLSGWGWQDNAYGAGALGPLVYFATTGSHTLRIQVREDGLSIDQVVLSPSTYLESSPGATKNDTTILTGDSPPPPPPDQVTVVRQPYLQQVTDRSATLVWASREPGPASAKVGGRTFAAASAFYSAASTRIGYDYYQHEARVTGLSGATTYAYDAYVGSVRVTPGTDRFRTAPTPGTGSAAFVIVGDSGTGSSQQKALAGRMQNETFDVMLHAGDLVYGNTGGTGDASHKTYQSWLFDIYRDLLRVKPFFPSMGNHDARASNDWGQAYLELFVLPDDAETGPHADHGERYYSFDYGPVHFVALDTELAFTEGPRRSAQRAWLEDDLSTTTQPWKVVYFHRSPYSSGNHGPDLDVRHAFGPLFERHGVQFVLSAHDHHYERSVPWRASTSVSNQAVVYFVTGGGGAPLYPVGRNEWTATSRSVHHFLKGYMSGCVAHFKAVDTTGAEIDRYRFDRCAQAADTAAPTVAFLEPNAGAAVSGSVQVKAAAGDDTLVEKVDLWVDGVLAGIDRTAPYELTWNTAGVSAGTHTLGLRAYDIDGNVAKRTRLVTVAP